LLVGVVLLVTAGTTIVLAQGKPAAATPVSTTPVQTVWPLPPETGRVEFKAVYATNEDVEGPRKKSRTFSIKETLLGKDAAGGQAGVRRLRKPFGVAIDSRGRVIATDTEAAQVVVFDPAARVYSVLGDGERQVSMRVPMGIAVDASDNIYIGDNGHGAVLVFGPDLRYLRMLGTRGDVKTPTGLAIDNQRQRLYAVDTRQHQLVAFDLSSGKIVQRTGTKGSKPGEFGFPTGVAVAPNGQIYVTDTMNYRVQVFDPSLKFVRTFGKLGINAGQFRRPKGIAIDSDGVVYVVDSDFNNFQMFDPEGRPLMAVGEFGPRPGQMMLPAGIAVQRTLRTIAIAEQATGRLQVFSRIGPTLGVP
jgi:DNA-binding beta-propeller fold protein YncE